MEAQQDSKNFNLIAGKNIRNARIIRKMSARELANRLGISENSLRKIERGEYPLEFELLSEISDSLNVTYRYLIENRNPIVFMRNSKIPIREKQSIIELAKYKANDVAALASIQKLQDSADLSLYKFEVNEESADNVGKIIAEQIKQSGNSIVHFLENHGIYTIKIESDTSFFKGLFVYTRDVPVIVLSKLETDKAEIYKTIGHELCHALLIKQKESCSEEELIESICNKFSAGFASKCLESNSPIGEVDFIERNAKKAWENELITSSKAAGYLDISTNEFLDMMRG